MLRSCKPSRIPPHLWLIVPPCRPGFCQLSAAEPKPTVMSPFTVEAEFGVDGLRIQNSQAVLNSFLLEQHGISQLQDVTGAAPNLATSNTDTRGFGDVLALRGITNSIFFTAPAIALVVDDVPGGSVSSYPSSLLAIDSFVVKAGPQGTDYGRNAPGGVIDIKTRTPGSQHRGKLSVDVGSFQSRAVQAAFDGPLSEQIGYSASIGVRDREGYLTNTLQKRTADDQRSVAGRGALHVRFDDRTQLRFGVLFEQAEDDANRLSSLFSPDRFAVSSDLNGETAIDRLQFSFQVRRTFDWGVMTATTSTQTFDVDPSLTDLDLSPLPLAFSRVVQNEELWTQEVRFESNPGSSSTRWRAGLFYLDSEVDGNALRQFLVPPSAFVPPNFVQTERTLSTLGQTNLAAYANLDHALSKQTTLKLGARLERAESELDRTKVATNSFGFPSPQDAPLQRSQASTYGSVSAGATHAWSESFSLMARTSLAQKPEGYSAFTGSAALARFDDERQWASEVGVTFGPPQGRFGGSLLAFWTQVDGYQFERTVPNSTDFVVVNAQEVAARGLEAKFMWNPVDRVWWDFQAGYTRATFENHRDASGVRVDGKSVPYVPRMTLRTGVTVDLGGGFSGNVSYAAVGETQYDERNTATFAQKRYGIASAHLRYRHDRWTVAVYGHNLFEKEYYQFINPEIYAGAPGAPRRFGVQLSYEL
jgi:iron complex outermembrane receptor protein